MSQKNGVQRLLSAFGIAFLAEIADKSRIVGLILATTYRAPWRVAQETPLPAAQQFGYESKS